MKIGFSVTICLLLSRALNATEISAGELGNRQYHASACFRNETIETAPHSAGYLPADKYFRSGRYKAAFVAYYQGFFCPFKVFGNSTIWPPPQDVDDDAELKAKGDAFWLPSQSKCREAIPMLERLVASNRYDFGEAELTIANCEWSLGHRALAVHAWRATEAMLGNPVGSDYLQEWPYELSARSMLRWAEGARRPSKPSQPRLNPRDRYMK